MADVYRHRGRVISGEDIAFLRQFIAEHPEMSRYALSCGICEAWQWKQANGALRDMVCRGLLLSLERAGQIELPPADARYAIHSQSGHDQNQWCRTIARCVGHWLISHH